MSDLRAYHREALDVTERIVDRVTVAALGGPTPCAAWNLGQLLAHMSGQNHGFAAAARGETGDLGSWADRPAGAEPAKVFAESATDVAAAFAADGFLDRGLWLPEFGTDVPFPARQAVGFQLVDTVVHAWDVAKSLGVPVEFGPELLAATVPIARAVPTGEARLTEGAAFAPRLDPADGAAALDVIVALLGRDPGWVPA